MNDQIITKVKKLLALANDAGASENERDSAMRQAQKLLAKHNLDMVDVHSSEQTEGREEVNLQTYGMPWCRDVCHHMAKLFFSRYSYGSKVNGTKLNHMFVGKTSNATTASLMSEYVIKSILKECRSRGWDNLSPEARSFSTGVARRLAQRIRDMIAAPEVEAGYAVVVVNLYKTEADANEVFIKQQVGALVKVKPRNSRVVGSAYSQGQAFGDKINLNSQIANSNTKRLS